MKKSHHRENRIYEEARRRNETFLEKLDIQYPIFPRTKKYTSASYDGKPSMPIVYKISSFRK